MGKEDIRLKTYLEDTRRYADLWNGSVFKGKQMLKAGGLKEAGERNKVFQNAGERLYRVRKDDRLYPIATLVIYWGEQEWNGPKSLHEMMTFNEKGTLLGAELRKLVPEYPLHFLDLTSFQHFEHFKTELRPLLELFQKRNSKENFLEYLNNTEKYENMDEESWYLLSQLTNSKSIRNLIQRRKQEEQEEKSMCKALDDLIADGKAEGKAEGRAESIVELLEEYGEVPDRLKIRIFTQKDLLLLSKWHKIAAHVSSVEEFVYQIDQ